MRLFLHTLSKIRIINGDQEWAGTPDAFAALEPGYPGLPLLTQSPALVRYWTPEWSYVEAANGQKHPNTVDCAVFCDNVATYPGATTPTPPEDDGFFLDVDTVLYECDPTDVTGIIILDGGKFTPADGSRYVVDGNISIDIGAHIASGETVAVGWWDIWLGVNSPQASYCMTPRCRPQTRQ